MSNHNLRQKLRHATVKYLAKPGCLCRSCKTWHDDVVPIKKERDDADDDARARVPIKREWQSDDDDAAVWVQSDDDGDDKGVDRRAFVQKLRNGRIDISALSVGSRYIWPTQWIVIAKHP